MRDNQTNAPTSVNGVAAPVRSNNQMPTAKAVTLLPISDNVCDAISA